MRDQLKREGVDSALSFNWGVWYQEYHGMFIRLIGKAFFSALFSYGQIKDRYGRFSYGWYS